MSIYIATSGQNIQSQSMHPQTDHTDTTTTSFVPGQQLATPKLFPCLREETESNHADINDQEIKPTRILLAAERLWTSAITTDCDDGMQFESIIGDSSPMLNRRNYDSANPQVLSGVESMKYRRYTTFSRLFGGIRLQWRILFYILVGLAVLVLIYTAMSRDASRLRNLGKDGYRVSATLEEDKNTMGQPPVRVKLDIYMESQCPDTAEFLRHQLSPTWAEMKEYIDLHIFPFGKARWAKQGEYDYSFQCQHGQNECLVNQLMSCGMEQLQTADRYLPYILCLQGTRFGKEVQKQCHEQIRLPHDQMITCANSTRGRHLHYRIGNLTKSLQPPMFFVPWILIDGKRDSAAVSNLKFVICKRLIANGAKSEVCERLTTPVAAG